MNESEISKASPADSDESSTKPLSYQERVDHFAAGYRNSQSVVQFLDKKASAIIGVVPVMIGLLAGLGAWLQKQWHLKELFQLIDAIFPVIALTVILLAAAWLLFGAIRAAMAAFDAVSPQDVGNTKPSILFPFATLKPPSSPERAFDVNYSSRAAFFVDGASRKDALEDYRRQVVRMSEIVAHKFTYLNNAVRYLKHMFAAAAALVILLILFTIITAGVHAYDTETSDETIAEAPFPSTTQPVVVQP